jgi:hypothetical protein
VLTASSSRNRILTHGVAPSLPHLKQIARNINHRLLEVERAQTTSDSRSSSLQDVSLKAPFTIVEVEACKKKRLGHPKVAQSTNRCCVMEPRLRRGRGVAEENG